MPQTPMWGLRENQTRYITYTDNIDHTYGKGGQMDIWTIINWCYQNSDESAQMKIEWNTNKIIDTKSKLIW